MQVYKFTVGNFGVNNYLVHFDPSPEAVLIDAGDVVQPVLKKIRELGLDLKYLINTHGHGDHIAGNSEVLQATGAKLVIHRDEVDFLQDPRLNLSGFLGVELVSPPADRIVSDGDKLSVNDVFLEVMHTPGHSPGHITVYLAGHAFVGDVIFREGIGRTDLPRANIQQLIESIRDRIYRLPEDTILYPGHGPNSTVGHEKVANPFVSMG